MWPLLVIGALTKYASTMDAQRRQGKLQEAMRAYQMRQAAANEQAIGGLIGQQTPEARGAELQTIQGSRASSMQGAVDAARSASPVTTVAGAASSQDYQKASAAAADTVANRTKRAIQQLSVMGAPGEQGMQAGMRFGRAAGKVDAGNMAIGNVGNAYLNAIKNTVPDPALSMVGEGLMAAGSSGGSAASSGGAMMGATNDGSYTYEDSAGNTQQSPFKYKPKKAAWPAAWGGT